MKWHGIQKLLKTRELEVALVLVVGQGTAGNNNYGPPCIKFKMEKLKGSQKILQKLPESLLLGLTCLWLVLAQFPILSGVSILWKLFIMC